jgi:hypothetical protein
MSIHEMAALHPEASSMGGDALATAARNAMLCQLMCSSCADVCTAQGMDMRQCIRACLDCADVCLAAARLATRQTGHNTATLDLMLQTCATICDRCGEQCLCYTAAHCRLCGEICHECARDCRAALLSLA